MIFMVGNLLDMGLRLKLREAFGGLRNMRFVVLSVVWGFVLCPALAYALTKVIPLEQPYAIGSVDQRAIVMVALGVPIQTIFSLLAARWFGRRASTGEPAAAQTYGGSA